MAQPGRISTEEHKRDATDAAPFEGQVQDKRDLEAIVSSENGAEHEHEATSEPAKLRYVQIS